MSAILFRPRSDLNGLTLKHVKCRSAYIRGSILDTTQHGSFCACVLNIRLKYKICQLGKYIWKRRLQNVSHFVPAPFRPQWVNTQACQMSFCVYTGLNLGYRSTWIILCMRSTNERRRYIVTSSLIGWAHTQNDPAHYVCRYPRPW